MSATQGSAFAGANRRRSQRVMLRMPVLVIARAHGGQHVSETTFTSVVNAHGALLQLSLNVKVGQRLIIRHPETQEEQFVRVVRTGQSEGKTEVAIEFLRPAPKFWRIAFPPEDWTPRPVEIGADVF
jgi:hypothetical protein